MFTAPLLDDASAADGSLGAPNWATFDFQGTAMQRTSGEFGNAAGGSYWIAPFGADHEVYVTYRAGSGIWLLFGVSSPDVDTSMTGYLLYWTSGTSELFRIDPGPRYTSLGSRAVSPSAGDLLGAGRYGSSIEAWHKPSAGAAVQDVAARDTTYTGNVIGLVHDSRSTRTDNFSGGTIVVAASAPPPLRRPERGLIMRPRRY